ncbi:MAG: ATP-binding protein [Chitinophagaceae bacterium]
MRDLAVGLDEAAKAELLTTIVDESERLNRFIANLLDMTRLESGAVVPRTALHDLGELVGSALQRAAKILARHRVELDLAADLPMLELDAVLFEQVLFNLLDNASKYAPTGTVVHIDSWRETASVSLRIMDEGVGIPPDDLEHIFDKFYRVEKGDQVRAGTGLGLAISRGFVEALKGTITAANRTDRTGAVFTIRLPIPVQNHQLDTGRMSAPALKVLIVDDEPPIRKLLRMGLGTQGYEVLDAPNARRRWNSWKASRILSSSTSACRTCRASICCAACVNRTTVCRLSFSPAAATKRQKWRRSTSAPTTM